MSYIKDNLMKDEKIITDGKVHWFIFIPSIVFLLIGLIVPSEIFLVKFILITASIIMLIKAFFAFISTELAVTTKRVIAKFGFIKRDTIELNHTKVESFNVNQGVFGRIFGFGTITINGTGGVKTPIPSIINPMDFRRKAIEQIEL